MRRAVLLLAAVGTAVCGLLVAPAYAAGETPGPSATADTSRAGSAGASDPASAPTPGASGASGASAPASSRSALPLFAFYYLWFDATSWNRAKTDYPLLGRYTSDDPGVMRQHIQWAKSAGIDGFIVSWKDTPTNNRRLRLLMDVARTEDFKLAMIYQGLDFDRNALPVGTVAADFETFRTQFSGDPVFYRIGGKPLTIWSGTWGFSHDEVAQVTGPVRDTMLVLNTQKNVDDYQKIADVTDGDAYYWSSVNPQTNTNHESKLQQMADAVHKNGQYWIAPFAPGFDARLVGGSKVVERNDGDTLRVEYAAAMSSSPDMLGLISWNEWSENSYVEPSERYGHTELEVLRELRGTPVPVPAAAQDSSESAPTDALDTWSASTSWRTFALLGGFFLLLFAGGALVRVSLSRRATRRQTGRRRAPEPINHELERRDVHVHW